MAQLYLSIITQNNSFLFEFECRESEKDSVRGRVLFPFMESFVEETNTLIIPEYQQNNVELRNKVKLVSEELKESSSKIYQLYNCFAKRMIDKQWFYISDKIVEREQYSEIQYKLTKLNESKDSDFFEYIKRIQTKLNEIYGITTFDENTHVAIGEQLKENRVCRYCGKAMPEVSFKKVAHTISEALGNKKIITNDECDACNQLFGDSIENDLIRVFDFPRFIYRIKGKNGVAHKIEGKNYTLFSDQNTGKAKLYQINNDRTKEELTTTNKSNALQLITTRPIPSENIYKCLVKYAIGVLDKEDITYLGKTIQWIKGEITESDLPPIAKLIDHSIVDHPQMVVFIRKDDDKQQDFPHIFVSIRLINTQFAFIIPFSDKDTNDFTKTENFTNVLDWFELFNGREWQIVPCNKNEVIIKLKSTDKK